ncbi:PREDICTED: netrin-3-like, partial [Amphimedon queenslandica]|uniref:Laminin EGF-like domain-containing protein n=1 Tax=Amphimedon queenslandica TaxID=400682 RepID=A0AAN0ITU4_AMPQE
CNCNNHTSSCVFDASLYDSTGSGGRCINCTHNTAGPHCSECAPGYYPQANVSVSSVNYCKSCDCNTAGTANASINCTAAVGQCSCKSNVQGPDCSMCVNGTYNLSSANPDGCQ